MRVCALKYFFWSAIPCVFTAVVIFCVFSFFYKDYFDGVLCHRDWTYFSFPHFAPCINEMARFYASMILGENICDEIFHRFVVVVDLVVWLLHLLSLYSYY